MVRDHVSGVGWPEKSCSVTDPKSNTSVDHKFNNVQHQERSRVKIEPRRTHFWSEAEHPEQPAEPSTCISRITGRSPGYHRLVEHYGQGYSQYF